MEYFYNFPELRIKGIVTIDKVKEGFLEPNGKVIILLNKVKQHLN